MSDTTRPHGARVCVLGHTGMLGHVVARYLRERGHHVTTIKSRFDPSNPQPFLSELADMRASWVVNCTGVGPRDGEANELRAINTELPRLCAENLTPGAVMIHASSDAVFSGQHENRRATEPPDATDAYGMSKRDAETAVLAAKGVVVRCSIVGPPSSSGRGLMGWLLAQRGEVPGYTDQWWNGITTLQWAHICDEIIHDASRGTGAVVQPGIWPAITKRELLVSLADVWELPVEIVPTPSGRPISRTLVPNHTTPTWLEQLHALRAWYHELRN